MQCDYLDYKGGWLGGYYCNKQDKSIDKSTVNTYCDNSLNYRNCPTFNKSSSPCYLTTAMCNILGQEDDGPVLNTLRHFRDTYMKNTPECKPLLEDYDTVGPIIAENLNSDKDKTLTANIMLYFFINPAIKSIIEEDYDNAIEIYKDMTINLMEKYNIDKSLLASQKVIGQNITRKKEVEFNY